MEDIEKLVKAARAQIDCDRFYKENNDCAGCEMPYKENPSYQKMCVGFDLFVLPKIVDALERQKNSNEVLRAERDELHKNNCELRAENERLRSTCYPRDGVEAIIRERDAYKEELAESQRREQAAVEDIEFLMQNSGEREACKLCTHNCIINSRVKPKCCDAKWRGPGAGEGEAE